MSMMKRFMGNQPQQTADEFENPFIPFFLKSEKEPNFPFVLALQTLEELEKTARSETELLEYMMEDIIFSSIYATFYEHLFVTIKENNHLTLELIDKFSETAKEREMLIAGQAEHHFRYILNGGQCAGCEACDNHSDVDDLIEYYETGDLNFFISLYLGMQTITFALEQLLYDILPHRTDITDQLGSDKILEYRQYLIEYAEDKLRSI